MKSSLLPPLKILGIGSYLPEQHDTRALARAAGADTSAYRGWDHVRIAKDDEHPGMMCARSLEEALKEAGIQSADLKLVMSCGMSRDFLPSWSIAVEAMRHTGAPSTCMALDVTLGCIGTLAALQSVQGWLAGEGGGYAAVVTAERWSYTIDRSKAERMPFWGHSDGGAALVVGMNVPGRALCDFQGSAYSTEARFNGGVLVPWGGTRHPVAPEGVVPYYRVPGHEFGLETEFDIKETKKRYMTGYTRVADLVKARFDTGFERLVCNQVSTGIVAMLPPLFGVMKEKTVETGHDSGHLGPADVIVGLRQLVDRGEIVGPIAMAVSSACGYGAGLLTPPA